MPMSWIVDLISLTLSVWPSMTIGLHWMWVLLISLVYVTWNVGLIVSSLICIGSLHVETVAGSWTQSEEAWWWMWVCVGKVRSVKYGHKPTDENPFSLFYCLSLSWSSALLDTLIGKSTPSKFRRRFFFEATSTPMCTKLYLHFKSYNTCYRSVVSEVRRS